MGHQGGCGHGLGTCACQTWPRKFLSPTRGAPNVTAVTGGMGLPGSFRWSPMAVRNPSTAACVLSYSSSALLESSS